MGRFSYDADFDPQAPYIDAEVETLAPGGPSPKQVRMLIDSGSFVTAVPQKSLKAIGVYESDYGTCYCQGFEGAVIERKTYMVKLRFADQDQLLEVVPINEKFGLIGRDLLNDLKTTLGGPDEGWDFEPIR